MTPTAGLSFKAVHYEQAMACPAAGLWFEVHAENYMVDGGPRLAMLEQLRRERPLSLHGVGLSLGSASEPDADHLAAAIADFGRRERRFGGLPSTPALTAAE